jgi:hypothetical protein
LREAAGTICGNKDLALVLVAVHGANFESLTAGIVVIDL